MNKIKESIKEQREIIEYAKSVIEKIQETCPHENQSEQRVMWRPAAYYNAMVCDNCGKILKNLDF